MRASEILRGLLDLIDKIESDPAEEKNDDIVDDPNRIKQIRDLMPCGCQDAVEYENEPQEAYASIEAVTTDAGGGVNGPKEPADLRGNSFRIYPSRRGE